MLFFWQIKEFIVFFFYCSHEASANHGSSRACGSEHTLEVTKVLTQKLVRDIGKGVDDGLGYPAGEGTVGGTRTQQQADSYSYP